MPHFEKILDISGRHLRRIADLLRLCIPFIVRLRTLRRILILWCQSLVASVSSSHVGVTPSRR
jgi:hypothetical protein